MSKLLKDESKIGLIGKLISEGKLESEIVYWLNKEGMCREYGWTPEQYDNMDIEDIKMFIAIQAGKAERGENNGSRHKHVVNARD